MRSTKRSQNKCGSCGYTWYPRGKYKSLKCPNCDSNEVSIVGGGGLILGLLFVGWLIFGNQAEKTKHAEPPPPAQKIQEGQATAPEQAELKAISEARTIINNKANNSNPDTKPTTEEAARDWISSKIRPKVQRYSANISGRTCTVQVTMIPGGEVQNVSVTQSSGDESFDRSVQAAVLKSSPLPWPDDDKVAEELKTFNLIVKSE
ncbi:MAG: cell envelope integrity protein TolA [Candidatus Methylumidiphilus sp.]